MSEFILIPSRPLEFGVTAKVRGEQTNDAYTVLELVLPPNAGAPLHMHQREDEVFFVAEGVVEIHHGGQTYFAEMGAVVVLPKGQPHSFRNSGDRPNRILITAIPGGLDRYFDEVRDATQDEIEVINRKYEINFSPDTF